MTNPREALSWLEQKTPDLIMIDQIIPELDGMALLERLHAHRHLATVPVVMVTAETSIGLRIAALERGCTDFLTKPIVVPELLARVQNLLKLRVRRHRRARGGRGSAPRQGGGGTGGPVEVEIPRLGQSRPAPADAVAVPVRGHPARPCAEQVRTRGARPSGTRAGRDEVTSGQPPRRLAPGRGRGAADVRRLSGERPARPHRRELCPGRQGQGPGLAHGRMPPDCSQRPRAAGNSERDRAQGLGLGLAIVQRISRLLDHPVLARSELGQGSVFSVEVPLGEGVAPAVRPPGGDAVASAGGDSLPERGRPDPRVEPAPVERDSAKRLHGCLSRFAECAAKCRPAFQDASFPHRFSEEVERRDVRTLQKTCNTRKTLCGAFLGTAFAMNKGSEDTVLDNNKEGVRHA